MLNHKITTAQDLKRVLKILAEESVNLAIEGKTSYEDEVKNQQKTSSKFLLDEKDDEGAEEEDPLFPDDKDSGEKGVVGDDDLDFGDEGGGEEQDLDAELDNPEQPPAPEEKPQKQYKNIGLDLKLGEITIDGMASVLNLMRGGRSFKDPNVSKELRKYFESLTEAEKLAMATFISALKDIAVGEPADQAANPDDPEMNLQIGSKNANQNTQQQNTQQNQPQAQPQPQQGQVQQNPQMAQGQMGQVPMTQPQMLPQAVPSDELEDTEAPIVVGRRNEAVDKEFREKIRELIKRGQSF